MKATQHLHDLGPCLWLDNITRDLDALAARLQEEGALAPATQTDGGES